MKGTIWFDDQFQFIDGTIGHKYFIVLNTPKNNEPYLFVKTTSDQLGHYKNVSYWCNPNRLIFYIPEGHCKEIFKQKTYVQLNEIFQLSGQELLKKSIQIRCIKKCGNLNEVHVDILNGLLNCLKRIKNDISEKHYNLIFPK